ncbi:cytochrome P450 [Xylaria longipes]|nr:cytochrome P450 [Xylaria longipes]RYC53633.1 hypothetical protein CHU98_g12576 [Xylaria longipes]
MSSTLGIVLGSVAAAYAFLFALLHFTQDSREPPVVGVTIPFISPLFGFISGMQKFSIKLRDKYGLPIYTLRMPGQRIYVVNSLSLIIQLQRQFKTVSFCPIESQAAATVMGVGPAGRAIIGSDKMLDDDSYLSTFVPSIRPGLSPGPGLDALNGAAIEHLSNCLSDLHSKTPTVIELFSWIRDQLCMATTEATYGPKNPFRDPAVQEAWYVFEPQIMVHMLGAWPSVLARKSLRAREHVLIPSFEEYFAQEGHLQGSVLTQCRYKHNIGHGIRGRDLAATEIGQLVASLVNSVGGAFWMIYNIFSDPVVLDECRKEVEKLVQVDGDGVPTIDIFKVGTACPILLSTWQETLRYMHIGISARVVLEDSMLDGKYLLKKGATVMMVTPVQNTDTSLWGPTAGKFDHRRFLRVSGSKQTNPAAFRSFGGGRVLCPGRHFVSTEVLSFVAILLLRFELKPLTKHGKWIRPRMNSPMTTAMPTPKDEFPVEVTPRDSREWRLSFSASNKGVDMVAEDVTEGA